MPRLLRATAATAVTLTLALAAMACSPGASPPASSATPPAQGSPSASGGGAASPSLEPTPPPAPSGTRTLPTGFAAALEPGTYWSAPPFDLGFAFEVAETGWVVGHLIPEFVDIQQFDGVAGEGRPTRIVGFAHPLEIHGPTIARAGALTPEEAVDLWVDRTDIETANVAELELLGGEAVRVDVHAPVPMVPLFGGDEGLFRLDSDFDIRVVVVAVDGGLFLATVHAPPAELEAAWRQALPILESIDLGDPAAS